MENLLQDVRFGARALRANPGFAAVAVITLALGIGANTAMFSVVNGVLLQPPDFPDPEQIVMIKRLDLEDGEVRSNTTAANFIAWQERAGSFSSMAVLGGDIAALTDSGETRRVAGIRSAGSLLEVLGTPALFGRTLTGADDAGGERVIVLTFEFWQSLFGDDQDILGRSLVLDNLPYTIVGVMPKGFTFRYYASLDVDYWTTSGWTPEYRQNRTNYAHEVMARLAPDVTIEQAQQEMNAIAADLRTAFPVANRNHGIMLVPLQEDLVAEVDSLLMLLMGAVGLVLLIATVNLANLLLARASSRTQEMAVRQAIGATPGRLARQVLTESVLLSLVGGAAGLMLAFVLTDLVVALFPGNIPHLERVTIDVQVLLFTLGAAGLAGVVFGLFPAVRLSRQSLGEATGGRGAARTSWTWNALVVSEVALSVILLIGAGLMLRTFVNLMLVDPGFRTERIMTFTVTLPGTYEPERLVAFWEELRTDLETLPGVTAASVASQLPAEPNRVSGWFNFVDRPVDNSDRSFLVPYRLVSPGYFEALGIPVIVGNTFSTQDGLDRPTAIVNEAAWNRFWGGETPLGDRIGIGNSEGGLFLPAAAVVGVVGDVRNEGLDAAAAPAVYFPVALASGWTNMTFALHTAGEPTSVLQAARDRVHRLEPAAPIFNEITVKQMLATQMAPTRAILQLIGSFAALGLAMAAIGVFGVLSYSVSQRTRELGMRRALGASSATLMSMVVGQAMSKVMIGVAVGMAGVFLADRFLGSMLYGVAAVDPITMVFVALTLGVVAALASYIPARRAARVDPMIALRSE